MVLILLAALLAGPDDFPLRAGWTWAYEGRRAWTLENSNTVRSRKLRWEMRVLDRREAPEALTAVIVSGWPSQLPWSSEGVSPESRLVMIADNALYPLRTSAGDVLKLFEAGPDAWATAIRRQEPTLVWPLKQGARWGGDEPYERTDGRYAWFVEAAGPERVSAVGGIRPVFHLAYRTAPDHQLIDFVPGVGITRYQYGHHGTVDEVDIRLIRIKRTSGQ